MERIWQRCMYDYLRVEPEEHYVLLVSGRPHTIGRRELLRSYSNGWGDK